MKSRKLINKYISIFGIFLSIISCSSFGADRNKENILPSERRNTTNHHSPFSQKNEEKPKSKPKIEHVLKGLRQVSQKDKKYLCALPSKKSANDLENFIQNSFPKCLKDITSTAVNTDMVMESFKERTPNTVVNCALLGWVGDKALHMSLKATVLDDAEKSKILETIRRVEFICIDADILGRYFGVFLDEPTPRANQTITKEDHELLRKCLEHSIDPISKKWVPIMHVSLIYLNNIKKQMKCIADNENEIEVIVSDKHFKQAISSAVGKRDAFTQRSAEKTLSEVSLYHLYLCSEDVRNTISKTLENRSSENTDNSKLTKFIENSSHDYIQAFLDLPLIVREYFLKEYNVDYDFTAKIGIKYDGISNYQLDENIVQNLLSRMFLEDNHNYKSINFKKFQKLINFYIENTYFEIQRKLNEIKNGRTNVDAGSFSLFDSVETPLTEAEKSGYIEQNRINTDIVNQLKSLLSISLIQNTFFGLDFNFTFFDDLYATNSNLMDEVMAHNSLSKRSFDEILTDLAPLVTEAVIKGKYFDLSHVNRNNSSEFKLMFEKKSSHFLIFKEIAIIDIQSKISTATHSRIADIENKQKNGHNKKKITFSDSKIPNVASWIQFKHNFKKDFDAYLKGMPIQFDELNSQMNQDDSEEDDD